MVKKEEKRLSVFVTVDSDVVFQPELSKVASAHGWTIWKCTEKEEKLEDVFYKLTNAS